jgi:hypothetical protein
MRNYTDPWTAWGTKHRLNDRGWKLLRAVRTIWDLAYATLLLTIGYWTIVAASTLSF